MAHVYEKDTYLTPALKEVVLDDLDGSGYLKNNYLSLLVLAGSPYDHPPYSLSGDFIYVPYEWDYQNVYIEGLKFDAASTYYYLTKARKYLENKFGFIQPDRVNVYMFEEDVWPHSCYVNSFGNPPGSEIHLPVPGYPTAHGQPIEWNPNYYRGYSTILHEYFHIVFNKYKQDLQYVRIPGHPSEVIDEALAIIWSTTVMDEPVYSADTNLPELGIPDLRVDIMYDPSGDLGNWIGALTSYLWDLRYTIGKDNFEQIVWKAMEYIPHAVDDYPMFKYSLHHASVVLFGQEYSALIRRLYSAHGFIGTGYDSIVDFTISNTKGTPLDADIEIYRLSDGEFLYNIQSHPDTGEAKIAIDFDIEYRIRKDGYEAVGGEIFYGPPQVDVNVSIKKDIAKPRIYPHIIPR
ncbi:hypothetical protein ACFL38_02315 [Candidatus Omnitrophota bacterium]